MTKTKLEAASLLVLGIEGLPPFLLPPVLAQSTEEDLPPVEMLPVSPRALAEAGTPEAAKDRQRLGVALTRVVLYVIVVELVVKHLWEEEKAADAEYTHNVRKLFEDLKLETQRQIRTIYDECCRGYDAAVQAGQQQHGPEAVAVDMANLEEALEWNEKAIKGFKYDLIPRGRSVPARVMWDSETMWILTPEFKNFAIEVADWASHRGTSAPA